MITPASRYELREGGGYSGTFVTDGGIWQIGDVFTTGDGRVLRVIGIVAVPQRSRERPIYTGGFIVEPVQSAPCPSLTPDGAPGFATHGVGAIRCYCGRRTILATKPRMLSARDEAIKRRSLNWGQRWGSPPPPPLVHVVCSLRCSRPRGLRRRGHETVALQFGSNAGGVALCIRAHSASSESTKVTSTFAWKRFSNALIQSSSA